MEEPSPTDPLVRGERSLAAIAALSGVGGLLVGLYNLINLRAQEGVEWIAAGCWFHLAWPFMLMSIASAVAAILLSKLRGPTLPSTWVAFGISAAGGLTWLALVILRKAV